MNLLLRKVVFVSISFILYLAALTLPYYYAAGSNHLSGFECLTSNPHSLHTVIEARNPFPFLAWVSNFIYFTGAVIFLIGRSYKTFLFADRLLLGGVLMSLGSLILYSHNGSLGCTPTIGCFVWIFSQVLMWAGIHFTRRELSDVAAH